MKKHVAVIGGGLAGASAAFELVKRGYEVTVFEKNDRLGGRIHSECRDGVAVEMGAGFMTDRYTNLWAFLRQNGLDSQMYKQRSTSGIYRDGKAAMATPGTLLGNKALSWKAKMCVLSLMSKVCTRWPYLALHAFWEADRYDNRSVAAVFSSSAQTEFLEYVLQPVLNSYFYWTPEHTSEAMLLILGKAALSHGTYKMRGGLQQIPELAAEGSTVLLGRTVENVEKQAGDTYRLDIRYQGKLQAVKADGIVCATTAHVVPAIFPELTKQQKVFFESIAYSTTALTAGIYERRQTRGSKAIAFPRREGSQLSVVTLSPEPGTNFAVLKTYASGAAGARFRVLSDDKIVQRLTAAAELVREEMLVEGPKLIATYIQKWPEALPLFDVGHFKRLRAFEDGDIEDQGQPVTFAGDYIGGPFMEGAFTSGMRAAERLDARLQRH